MRSICKVEDCNKDVKGLGYCRLHWERYKKYGDPMFVKHIWRINPKAKCLVEGCTKKVVAKGLCGNHNNRRLKTGSPTTPLKVARYPKNSTCKVEDCRGKIRGKGYCGKHYTRLRNHGDVSVVKTISKYPEDSVCKVEGCKNKVLANFMCSKHYQMWKEHGDPKGGRYEYKIRKAITHSDGTRTCSECEKRLPIANFHKDKNASDGYRSKCKNCRLKMVKKWYLKDVITRRKVASDRRKKDPEKARKDDLERYGRDREKRIALATEHSHLRKARKKKTKTERGISKLALKKKFGTKCYYCGKEMDFSVGKGRIFNRDMATIEHLIPLARGGEHTFVNTVLACRYCNISKNSKSEEEFEIYKNT